MSVILHRQEDPITGEVTFRIVAHAQYITLGEALEEMEGLGVNPEDDIKRILLFSIRDLAVRELEAMDG